MQIILALFLIQFNVENKHVFYPQPARAESTHSYDVLHYFIDLDLPMDSRYLEGAVTISARSNEDNLTMIDLHLLGLTVDSVAVDGMATTYSHTGETLFVDLPQPQSVGDSFSVMVGYSGTCSGGMGYLWYSNIHPISYTLGCPFCTKRWMPCYDYMADKADYGVEFYVTVPDSFTVCANGEYLGRNVAGGMATYHWKHDFPIAPYLVHFAASTFTTYSDWYVPATGDSIEVMYYFWPQDSTHAPTAFQYTTDMLYFYDSLYGEYPFEKYGMAILYPFYYAGMEHQTLSSIYRTGFLGNDYNLMAHEMSHMWWGDMVTCFGWVNVWLNEGFATYSDALYWERQYGHQSFINEMILRRNYYFSAEASHPRPLYDPTLGDLFCWGHDYCKASWVLHMIRYLCGDDITWLSLMATYRDAFEYGNASTDDFNNVMNNVLADNYDWFFDEWVYDMGYPFYDIVWTKAYEAPNWRLVLDITQTQAIGPPVFHMPLPVGIDYATGDTILTLIITESPQHFEFVLAEEPIDITVDPETWIIQKNTVTAGIHEYVEHNVVIDQMSTIGRAIELKLSAPAVVKIFDIAGCKVHETVTAQLHYTPSSTGIYHVFVGDTNHRVVVLR